MHVSAAIPSAKDTSLTWDKIIWHVEQLFLIFTISETIKIKWQKTGYI